MRLKDRTATGRAHAWLRGGRGALFLSCSRGPARRYSPGTIMGVRRVAKAQKESDWLEGGDAAKPDALTADDMRQLGDTVDKGRGCIVTKSLLSKLTGWNTKQIDKWVRAGLPVHSRGSSTKRWEFNTAEVIKWVRARDITDAAKTGDAPDGGPSEFDIAKTREKEAHARQRELEVAQKEGRLIDVAVVESWVSKKFGDFRARILQIVPGLIAFTAEQRDEVKAAITAALAELSGVPHVESGTDRPSDDFDSGDGDEEIIS